MEHFAGLDVSVKDTSVCIVDDTGKIVREVKVASEPAALLAVLKNPAYRFKRIGLEAGPLSQWLFSALAEVGLPVICVETRHMRAALKAQINKTDRNDARGMAQMMRVGLYLPLERPLASVLVVSGTGNVSLLQPGACPLGSYFRSVVVRIVCSHCCSMPESKITLRHLMISRFNRSESSSGLVGSGSRPSSV